MNKVVIVTGSSRGIGEAIAIEFAKAEYNLVINSRHSEELSVSKQEIMKVANSDIDILEFPGDISEERVCSGIVDAAIQKFGRIDVLVNNAGISGPEKKSSEITSEEWNEVININFKRLFYVYITDVCRDFVIISGLSGSILVAPSKALLPTALNLSIYLTKHYYKGTVIIP